MSSKSSLSLLEVSSLRMQDEASPLTYPQQDGINTFGLSTFSPADLSHIGPDNSPHTSPPHFPQNHSLCVSPEAMLAQDNIGDNIGKNNHDAVPDIDELLIGGSSLPSIVSSYSPSPAQEASAHEAQPSMSPPIEHEESAVKRYLRYRFSGHAPTGLSTLLCPKAKTDLSKAGFRSSDHFNLYNICFALSASFMDELFDPDLHLSPVTLTQEVVCKQCSDVTCVQEECLRDLSSQVSVIDDTLWIDAQGNSNLHRAVQHGRKTYVTKLLDLGADPWAENGESMNPAVYGWGFLILHKEDDRKYANIWLCMFRVLEKQREMTETKVAMPNCP
jgi:hypothetical protein